MMTEELQYRQNPNFPNRYIPPKKLFFYLEENFSGDIVEIGTSYLGKPIYKMTCGNGAVKVLAWSQMHGNESNATHAMLDLLEIFSYQPELKNRLFAEISLDFIFMLNPDGSEKWMRSNNLGIDINRDFLKLESKELPILKHIAETGNYHYALNLHEQRTIFTTDGEHPATLSFLAPSVNHQREITEVRKKAMAVVSKMYKKLDPLLPNQIARYSDEFYPTSVGDNFSKMGLPTILFEGGHDGGDYKRTGTRKYYTLALFESLKAIAELKGATENWEAYQKIPENKETHCDRIYRNVRLNTDFEAVIDIAIQYREELRDGDDEIALVPIVLKVGDVGTKKGWEEIDCTGKTFVSERKFPKLDAEVDFKIQ